MTILIILDDNFSDTNFIGTENLPTQVVIFKCQIYLNMVALPCGPDNIHFQGHIHHVIYL